MKTKLLLIVATFFTLSINAQIYMYGTTSEGGANNLGTIYRVDENGQNFEKLFDFTTATGGTPLSGLTLGNNNKLYGFTTSDGQIVNAGAIIALGSFYEFDPVTENLTVIEYIDDKSAIGNTFKSSPTKGSGNLLYMASETNGIAVFDGVLSSFDVDSQSFTVLDTFDAFFGQPKSKLLMASDNNLYVTTANGGEYGHGAVVKYDVNAGVLTRLHSSDWNNGGSPENNDYNNVSNNPLFEASNGALYGSSLNGGTTITGAGMAYTINKDGTGYQIVFNLMSSGVNDEGFFPQGGFVEINGLLYSTTPEEFIGGLNSGTIYTIDIVTNTIDFVYTLDLEGAEPRGTFVIAPNGRLYITCKGGILNSGSLIEYRPITNTVTTRHTFNAADGIKPNNNELALVDLTDTTPPIALCQDITVALDQNGVVTITAAQVDNGSSDNQGSVLLSVSPNSFDCSNIGPNTVTLTATDPSGNSAICSAIVTVEDNTDPMATCQNFTTQLDVNGNAIITPTQVDDGSGDACGVASLSIDNDTFDCSNLGSNTVVLTVTDASGNSDSCTATVTVEDNIAPTMACQDITIQLDANGIATITPADIDNGSTDACGISIRFLDNTFFDCSNIGTNTVIMGIIDVNGNVATCSAVVTVEDTLAPVLECPEDEMVTVEAGTTYSIPDYTAFGDVTAIDNCTDPLVITQDPAPGTELSVGVYIVSFETTDDEGNTDSCSFLLSVDELLGNSNSDFDKNLVIFPNPMKNSLSIENSGNLSISEIRLLDTLGRLVLKTNTISNSLDVSGLNSGLYFIQLEIDNRQIITKKIIKK